MHRSPQNIPHILTKKTHPENNIQRYIKSICIAHTLCKKKNNIENKIIELMGSLFFHIEIKGLVRDCKEEQGRSNAMCWGSGRPGHCCGDRPHVAHPSERRTRLMEGLSRSSRGLPSPRGEWNSFLCSSRSLPS